ncbi:MAG: phage holin family protein [Bryobacteraceae bacterium]
MQVLETGDFMGASDNRVSYNSPLAELVRRGRRKHFLQILVDEAGLALAVAFGAAIVLLVLGTQLLDWYWVAAIVGAGAGVGIWRGRKRIASGYEIARKLDQNLALKDALSTAFFFEENPGRTRSPAAVVERQRELAQDLARSADIHRGLPFVVARSAYVSGILALVAIGVFGLRYGVTRTMDLRPSLVRIAFDGFLGPSSTRIADARRKPNDPRAKDLANPSTLKYDPWQAQTMDQKGAPDAALSTIDTPNVDNSNNTGPAAETKANGKESKNTPDSFSDHPDDSASANPDQAPDGSSAPAKDGSKAGSPPPGDRKSQNAENSSLTDKMRDALANLLSKLKMQPKSGGNKSGGQQQNQNTGQQQTAQNRQSNQNGQQSSGKPQSDAMASPDGQANQDAQGSEQAKSGQGKSNGKSDERSSSQDGKSGIGKQDGDKSLKEAEQLAAMGKISEIIGKRAQNVSGEVMVEVASGNQQLRTQYSQRKAAHADTGGEISRDEVPLAYQQYVQQYFEEIRKLPAAPSAKPAKKAPDPPKKTGSS